MKVKRRIKIQKPFFLKTVSLIVLLCFTATTITWAAPDHTASLAAHSLTSKIGHLALNEKLGRVDEVFIPSELLDDFPFIIYLQDAHANLGAQENISKIARQLGKEFKPEAILAEGGSGELDFSELREFPDQKIKERAGRFWLREMVLNGASYEAIVGPEKYRFFGVEDPVAYEEGGKYFIETHSQSKSILSSIKPLVLKNQKLKKERYNKPLLRFEELVSKFDSRSELISLVSLIANEARNLHINRWKYKEIEKFIDLIVIELEGGNAERLFEVQKNLDPRKLFEEVDLLKAEIKEALFQNDEERAIDQEERILNVLQAIASLEAMPSDYDYFSKHRDLMTRYTKERKLDLESFQSADAFYKSARARDEKIFENIKEILKVNQIKRALLVTGGFHSPGITERFRKENIPFILITPQISDEDNFENYYERISGKRADLDEFKKSHAPNASAYAASIPGRSELKVIGESFHYLESAQKGGLTQAMNEVTEIPVAVAATGSGFLWAAVIGFAAETAGRIESSNRSEVRGRQPEGVRVTADIEIESGGHLIFNNKFFYPIVSVSERTLPSGISEIFIELDRSGHIQPPTYSSNLGPGEWPKSALINDTRWRYLAPRSEVSTSQREPVVTGRANTNWVDAAWAKTTGGRNQDVVIIAQDSRKKTGVYGVADGVSAATYSERAGEIVGEVFKKAISESRFKHGMRWREIKEVVRTVIEDSILQMGEEGKRDESLGEISTTLAFALILGDRLYPVSVGDSQVYVQFKDGKVRQVTKDRSVFDHPEHMRIHVRGYENIFNEIYPGGFSQFPSDLKAVIEHRAKQIPEQIAYGIGFPVIYFGKPILLSRVDRIIVTSDGLPNTLRHYDYENDMKISTIDDGGSNVLEAFQKLLGTGKNVRETARRLIEKPVRRVGRLDDTTVILVKPKAVTIRSEARGPFGDDDAVRHSEQELLNERIEKMTQDYFYLSQIAHDFSGYLADLITSEFLEQLDRVKWEHGPEAEKLSALAGKVRVLNGHLTAALQSFQLFWETFNSLKESIAQLQLAELEQREEEIGHQFFLLKHSIGGFFQIGGDALKVIAQAQEIIDRRDKEKDRKARADKAWNSFIVLWNYVVSIHHLPDDFLKAMPDDGFVKTLISLNTVFQDLKSELEKAEPTPELVAQKANRFCQAMEVSFQNFKELILNDHKALSATHSPDGANEVFATLAVLLNPDILKDKTGRQVSFGIFSLKDLVDLGLLTVDATNGSISFPSGAAKVLLAGQYQTTLENIMKTSYSYLNSYLAEAGIGRSEARQKRSKADGSYSGSQNRGGEKELRQVTNEELKNLIENRRTWQDRLRIIEVLKSRLSPGLEPNVPNLAAVSEGVTREAQLRAFFTGENKITYEEAGVIRAQESNRRYRDKKHREKRGPEQFENLKDLKEKLRSFVFKSSDEELGEELIDQIAVVGPDGVEKRVSLRPFGILSERYSAWNEVLAHLEKLKAPYILELYPDRGYVRVMRAKDLRRAGRTVGKSHRSEAREDIFNYDKDRKKLIVEEPIRLAINLGAYRVYRNKAGKTVFTEDLRSNFDRTDAIVANTVSNRVFDAYIRELIGEPNISLTDIYGVEHIERFYALLRGNEYHGRFPADSVELKKGNTLVINGHSIRLHREPPTQRLLKQAKTEYLIDLSNPALTGETEEIRQKRLQDLFVQTKLKRAFAFFPNEDPKLTEAIVPGVNAEEIAQNGAQYFALASPVTLATTHILKVVETHFEGEFEFFGGVQALRPTTSGSAGMRFVDDVVFGKSLQRIFPDFAPKTRGSLAAMTEYPAPRGSGRIRLLLNPRPDSKFAQIAKLDKKLQKEEMAKLTREINQVFENAANGALKDYLRYAGEEHLNSLLTMRDQHPVVFDSQQTAVLESGQVEFFFWFGDMGYVAALNRLIKGVMRQDRTTATAAEIAVFESNVQKEWPEGTIQPNLVKGKEKWTKDGEEIGFVIVGVRGRIGKLLHQLLTSNPNYIPKAWLGVRDIDTLIQQFREDVVHGPMDLTDGLDFFELEKGKDGYEGKILLRNKKTGEYLPNPRAPTEPLAIPYYHIQRRPEESQDAFDRRLRNELGSVIDETETVINAAGFALDKNDPYYNAFKESKSLKRIILTAPAKGQVDLTAIRGVNENQIIDVIQAHGEDRPVFISCASCTTTGLARALLEMVQFLEPWGVKYTRFLTDHSITTSQVGGDPYGAPEAGKSLRTAITGLMSSTPEATGANKAIVEVRLEFKSKLSGISSRNANFDGSVVVANLLIPKSDRPFPTEKEINQHFEALSKEPHLKGVISYEPEIRTTDQIVDEKSSSIFIPWQTRVEEGEGSALITVAFGYDNEAGYANAVAHLEELAAQSQHGLITPESAGVLSFPPAGETKRSEARAEREVSGIPEYIEKFIREELQVDLNALDSIQYKTIVRFLPFISKFDNFRWNKQRELIRNDFKTAIQSPSSFQQIFIESALFEAPMSAYALQTFLELLSVETVPPKLRKLVVDRIRSTVNQNKEVGVQECAIDALVHAGEEGVPALLEYNLPIMDPDIQRRAFFALLRNQEMVLEIVTKRLSISTDESNRKFLASILSRMLKQIDRSIDDRLLALFLGVQEDHPFLRRIKKLFGPEIPSFSDLVDSRLFAPASTLEHVQLSERAVSKLEKFKIFIGEEYFTNLIKTYGLSKIAQWANSDYQDKKEILIFMASLKIASVEELAEAIEKAQERYGYDFSKQFLLLNSLGRNVYRLILHDPVRFSHLMAYEILNHKLSKPIGYLEETFPQEQISELLHSDIEPVYYLARKLAKTIPHRTSGGEVSRIRDLSTKLNQHYGALFNYMRLVLHRTPSTLDTDLMAASVDALLRFHHPDLQLKIQNSEIDRILGAIVREDKKAEVYSYFKTPQAREVAQVLHRELAGAGVVDQGVEYFKNHEPAWKDFTEEEKSTAAFQSAKTLVDLLRAVKASYEIDSAQLEQAAFEEKSVIKKLRELRNRRSENKKRLLRSDLLLDPYKDYYFKRHQAIDQGFPLFGFYGTYRETKFDTFEADRGLEFYAEILHDKFLKEGFLENLNQIKNWARENSRKASSSEPGTIVAIDESVQISLLEMLEGLGLLVDHMALDGLANRRLQQLNRVLREDHLDLQQISNVLGLMSEEILRIYDFFNFTYGDYPKIIAANLGRDNINPRYLKDGEEELTELEWAQRVHETVVADLQAEERSIVLLKRYLDQLMELLNRDLNAWGRSFLREPPEKDRPMVIHDDNFNSSTMSPADLGSKAYEQFELRKEGLPVPALVNFPAYVSHQVPLSVRNPKFRKIVLEGILRLEKQTGKVFPFDRTRLSAEERKIIRDFRKEHHIDGKGEVLLISVRSGSYLSMPGMMDSVLNIPFTETVKRKLRKEHKNHKFILDSEMRFLSAFGVVHYGMATRLFSEIVDATKKRIAEETDQDVRTVSISQFRPREMKKVLSAYKAELLGKDPHFLNSGDPFQQVLLLVIDIFKSWNNERARNFRKTFSISERFGTAVTLQQMIFGNLNNDSGTAVAQSRRWETGELIPVGAWRQKTQGPDLVGGTIGFAQPISRVEGPNSLQEMKPDIYRQLVDNNSKIDRREMSIQDTEWTWENNKLYLLQTRPFMSVGKGVRKILIPEGIDSGIKLIGTGEPISPNAAVGRLLDIRDIRGVREMSLKRIRSMVRGLRAEMDKNGEQDLDIIFVYDYFTDEDAGNILAVRNELGARGSAGIINSKIGSTHAGLVSRKLGIAYVSSLPEEVLRFETGTERVFLGGKELRFGMAGPIISIDGYPAVGDFRSETSGHVFLGRVPFSVYEQPASRSEARTTEQIVAKVEELARNLAREWDPEVKTLSQRAQNLLQTIGKNPKENKEKLSEKVLREATALAVDYDKYLAGTDDQKQHRQDLGLKENERVAYFSMEFGVTNRLNIYGGGLGILSGDHLRGASDYYPQNTFVAIGPYWKEGYFRQEIDHLGWQQASYPTVKVEEYGVWVKDPATGQDLIFQVVLPNKGGDFLIYGKAFHLKAGRQDLYLITTDVPENDQFDPSYKDLLNQLYFGGNRITRLMQEIVTGFMGIQLMKKLGLETSALHLNEGHMVFSVLELIRQEMFRRGKMLGFREEEVADLNRNHREKAKALGLTFEQSKEAISKKIGFTSHTPVPAGNETFETIDVQNFLRPYSNSIGTSLDEIMNLKEEKETVFNLTEFVLSLANYYNAVSKRHRQVAAEMHERSNFDHITNAVHRRFWQHPELQQLLETALERLKVAHPEKQFKNVDALNFEEMKELMSHLSNQELAEVKNKMRRWGAQFIKDRMQREYQTDLSLNSDPDAFTIVIARRFATYKRADLILDIASKIIEYAKSLGIKAQIVFAGKAHPEDNEGKRIIQKIHSHSRDTSLAESVFFVPGYDIDISKALQALASIWLNNPEPPKEASGTSGMKAEMNGVKNISTPDGWVLEAEGSVILFGEPGDSPLVLREKLLGKMIEQINLFAKDRNRWIDDMRLSISNAVANFNMPRLIRQYHEKMYRPNIEASHKADTEYLYQANQLLLDPILKKEAERRLLLLQNPKELLTSEEFAHLLSLSVKQSYVDDSQSLAPYVVSALSNLTTPEQRRAFLAPIARLPLKGAEKLFGKEALPRVMALITGAAPELLDEEMKNWHPKAAGRLNLIRPMLRNVDFYHAKKEPGGINILAYGQDGYAQIPIYLPAHGPIVDGKTWFTLDGVDSKRAFGLLPGSKIFTEAFAEVTDFTVGNFPTGHSYPRKTVAELVSGHRVGVSRIEGPDWNGVYQPSWGFQALKIRLARSEARATRKSSWPYRPPEKIAVVGTGFVGTTKAVILVTDWGHDVIAVDVDPRKIEMLKAGKTVQYIRGMDKLLPEALASGRLNFTNDLAHAIKDRDIIFLAIQTPQNDSGEADIRFLEKAVRDIAHLIESGEAKILVVKSTAPPSVKKRLEEVALEEIRKRNFDKTPTIHIVREPEFLREGSEITDDRKWAGRIIIGSDNPSVARRIQNLYQYQYRNPKYEREKLPILLMDTQSAALVKYAANGWRSTKISFINYIGQLAEAVGLDIVDIANVLGEDPRIIRDFLNCGLGFGGSCFPKDVAAYVQIAKRNKVPPDLSMDVLAVNDFQWRHFLTQIVKRLDGVEGKTIVILGGAFKPGTDDVREARSILLVRELLNRGARIKLFDPKANEALLHGEFKGDTEIDYFNDINELYKNENLRRMQAIVLVTEWDEFKSLSFERLREHLSRAKELPLIFDGRNAWNPEEVTKHGFSYTGVGRSLGKSKKPTVVREEFIEQVKRMYLALRVSFMNQLAEVAERENANIRDVIKGLSFDPVVGKKYLYPNIGFGGHELPEALSYIENLSREYLNDYLEAFRDIRGVFEEKFGYEAPFDDDQKPTPFISAIRAINKRQIDLYMAKIEEAADGNLKGKTIAVLGLAYKAGVGKFSIENAPSLELIQRLLQKGAVVQATDGYIQTGVNARRELTKPEWRLLNSEKDRFFVFHEERNALRGSDIQVLVTGWPEYRYLENKFFDEDGNQLPAARKVVDARHFYNPEKLMAQGIEYFSVGVPARSEARAKFKNTFNILMTPIQDGQTVFTIGGRQFRIYFAKVIERILHQLVISKIEAIESDQSSLLDLKSDYGMLIHGAFSYLGPVIYPDFNEPVKLTVTYENRGVRVSGVIGAALSGRIFVNVFIDFSDANAEVEVFTWQREGVGLDSARGLDPYVKAEMAKKLLKPLIFFPAVWEKDPSVRQNALYAFGLQDFKESIQMLKQLVHPDRRSESRSNQKRALSPLALNDEYVEFETEPAWTWNGAFLILGNAAFLGLAVMGSSAFFHGLAAAGWTGWTLSSFMIGSASALVLLAARWVIRFVKKKEAEEKDVTKAVDVLEQKLDELGIPSSQVEWFYTPSSRVQNIKLKPGQKVSFYYVSEDVIEKAEEILQRGGDFEVRIVPVQYLTDLFTTRRSLMERIMLSLVSAEEIAGTVTIESISNSSYDGRRSEVRPDVTIRSEARQLFQEHKDRFKGLNITQPAKQIAASVPGLSLHLQKHPKERSIIEERLDRTVQLLKEKNRPVQIQENELPGLKVDVTSVESVAQPAESQMLESKRTIIIPFKELESRSELRNKFVGFLVKEGNNPGLRLVVTGAFKSPFLFEDRIIKLFPELAEKIFLYQSFYIEAGDGRETHVASRVIDREKIITASQPVLIGDEELFSILTRKDARKIEIHAETLDQLFEAALLLSQVPDDVWFRLAGTEGVVDLTRISLEDIRDAVQGQFRLRVAA